VKHELHPGFTATIEGDGVALVRALWPSIVDEIAHAVAELRDNYTDGHGSGDLWSQVVDPTIIPTGPRGLELVCTFTWQNAADPHVITLMVVDGEVVGYTADG
jgi:hypothetical protein